MHNGSLIQKRESREILDFRRRKLSVKIERNISRISYEFIRYMILQRLETIGRGNFISFFRTENWVFLNLFAEYARFICVQRLYNSKMNFQIFSSQCNHNREANLN